VFSARDVELPGSLAPVSAWDLDEIRPEYESFLELFRPSAKGKSTDKISPADSLVLRTRAVYRWFVISTLDPDLPAPLLPLDWPRVEARRVFVEVVDRLTPLADGYVRSVIGEYAPELASRVTLPPRYGPAT
jgi:phenylacetic acid degradation operon negative regulatory protein